MFHIHSVFLRWLYITVLISLTACAVSCTSTHIFSGRTNAVILKSGNVEIPLGTEGRAAALIDEFGKNDLSGAVVQELINHWAQMELPSWDINGAKVTAPRILLAKLTKGVDIEKVNDYLVNTASAPWSESGSTWSLRNGGDYDFTEVPLTAVLYKFGNNSELIYPETKKHLLHTLLIESGDRVRPYVPGSLNLVPDTENHILMTEGSRYLKNQWLRNMEGFTEPEYNNQTNGVEAFLLSFLDELIGAGLFEFNSMPYSGYTITALMNLEAFAEDSVASKARELLDTIMYKFALSSLDTRRCVPFRRQLVKAGTTSVQADDASLISRVWISIDDPDFEILPITERLHQPFYAAIMPYRVPDKTLELIKEKASPYFVQLGRGPESSPEIYSGGDGWLLSAGGVSRGRKSMIVARPTTLLLSDNKIDYTDCFYLPGRRNYEDWNNTGVFRNFACSNAPVVIPSWAEASADVDGWRVYDAGPSLLTAVFNDPDHEYGILVIFPDFPSSAEVLAQSLSDSNPDSDLLEGEFRHPNGEVIGYEINAPKNKWVINSFNGAALNRDIDNWPVINSRFYGLN